MNAARDILDDLAAIGGTIDRAGDRLILRAGVAAIPAALINRIRQAKPELLATLANQAAPLASPTLWEAKPALREIATTPINRARAPSTEPEPSGRHWLALLTWGATPKQARTLALKVEGAAGAPGALRRAAVGELYNKLARFGCSGDEKIGRLRDWAAKMERDPLYWPTSRPDRTAAARARRDKVIAIVKAAGGRITKRKLIRVLGWSLAAVSRLVLSMIKSGEFIDIAPGVYALPQSGVKPHVSAAQAIMALNNQSKP